MKVYRRLARRQTENRQLCHCQSLYSPLSSAGHRRDGSEPSVVQIPEQNSDPESRIQILLFFVVWFGLVTD